MRLRSALLATSLVFAGSSAIAADAAHPHHKPVVRHVHKPKVAGGVSVVIDQVRIVTFARPVSTIFIGNPIIADATVIDPHHAFILGKTFGVTNMIALSAENQPISNQQITVANRSGGVVTLNRGGAQFTFSCTSSHCETGPRPGDQKAFVEENSDAVTKHQDDSVKAASAAQAQPH